MLPEHEYVCMYLMVEATLYALCSLLVAVCMDKIIKIACMCYQIKMYSSKVTYRYVEAYTKFYNCSFNIDRSDLYLYVKGNITMVRYIKCKVNAYVFIQ